MIFVYTDGAMEGDGWSGAGIVIHYNQQVKEYSIPLGQLSKNQEAEFEAMVQAMHICKDHFAQEIISFRLDARVVVDAVEKNFTKNKVFRPYLKDIQHLSDTFPYVFVKWISQIENQRADELAKQAIHLNE